MSHSHLQSYSLNNLTAINVKFVHVDFMSLQSSVPKFKVYRSVLCLVSSKQMLSEIEAKYKGVQCG